MEKIEWEEFEILYPMGTPVLRSVSPELVYEEYYNKVYPNLDIIAEFMARDVPATEMQIKFGLGISGRVWNACKEIFPELVEYLGCKESFMQFKTEVDLQTGMVNTEYKNPKLHDIRMQLYNERYKKKSDNEVNIDLPKIEVHIHDAELLEDELSDLYDLDESDL